MRWGAPRTAASQDALPRRSLTGTIASSLSATAAGERTSSRRLRSARDLIMHS